ALPGSSLSRASGNRDRLVLFETVGVDRVALMAASGRARATVRTLVTASLLCVLAAGCGSHSKTAKPHLSDAGPGDPSSRSAGKARTFTYQQLTIHFPATSTDDQKAVFAA